jgi:hypothetical protein
VLDVANSELIYGEPFLTVIASLMASPKGQLSWISDIWHGQLALQLIGYNLESLDEDCSIVLAMASVNSASCTFTSSKITSTFESNLEETIYTLAGVELCKASHHRNSSSWMSARGPTWDR